MPEATQQVIKFILVGIVTTLIHFAVLSVFFHYLTFGIITSTVVAFFIAVVFSYLMSYSIVYKSSQRHEKSIPKFGVSVAVGFFWNVSLMYILVEYLNQEYRLAFLATTLVVVINNFLLTKFWVFKT